MITLKEAIETLSDDRFGCCWPTPKSEIEAVKLGIEALKFKQSIRAHTVDDFDALLPGETEE